MTREQIEKFAVGYPVPTDWVAALLYKYDYDKDKAHEILCKAKKEITLEVQNAVII